MGKLSGRRGAQRVSALLLSAALVALSGCQMTNEVVLRRQANSAMTRGDTSTARQKYQRLVELDPTNARYQYGYGATQLRAGNLTEAKLALERARRLEPDRRGFTPKVLDKLAEAYYRQDDERRLRAFLKQTTRERKTASRFLRQARYLRKLGDVDAARTAYRKAVIFASDRNPEPYLEIAEFYQSIGDRENAVKALRQAYHIDPANERVAQRLRQYGIERVDADGAAPSQPALMNDG